jgi:hypothetical protein
LPSVNKTLSTFCGLTSHFFQLYCSTKAICIKKILHFEFWILIFSQASDMQSKPFSGCQAAAVTVASGQLSITRGTLWDAGDCVVKLMMLVGELELLRSHA